MITINDVKKIALMQIHVSLQLQILTSLLIMFVMISFVYLFNIPNPNMILIAGLVFCSALFGYGGGITAGVIMFLYTLYFFSTNHTFIDFTGKNLDKVIVSLIGIVTDMIFVCQLKHSEITSFNEIQKLTKKLQEENKRLHEISFIDGLTGIKNRLALRHDYHLYDNREVTVVMLDLDNFKSINDHLGHEEGDRVIRETGALLKKYFNREYCYRYGGDEFLIIYPNIPEEDFLEKLHSLIASRPTHQFNGETVQAGYSIGYVHKKLDSNTQLRDLFSIADERMYQSKRGGKNKAVGNLA